MKLTRQREYMASKGERARNTTRKVDRVGQVETVERRWCPFKIHILLGFLGLFSVFYSFQSIVLIHGLLTCLLVISPCRSVAALRRRVEPQILIRQTRIIISAFHSHYYSLIYFLASEIITFVCWWRQFKMQIFSRIYLLKMLGVLNFSPKLRITIYGRIN